MLPRRRSWPRRRRNERLGPRPPRQAPAEGSALTPLRTLLDIAIEAELRAGRWASKQAIADAAGISATTLSQKRGVRSDAFEAVMGVLGYELTLARSK